MPEKKSKTCRLWQRFEANWCPGETKAAAKFSNELDRLVTTTHKEASNAALAIFTLKTKRGRKP